MIAAADGSATGLRARAGAITSALLFGAFVLLILLSPLPLGGEFPAGWSALSVTAGVLLLVWTGLAAVGVEPVRLPITAIAWIAVPFALALVWIGLQGAGWTPQAWHHPIWSEARTALGRPVDSRITVDAFATGSGALRLLAFAAVFWLALQFGRERARARLMLIAFVLAQAAYAAYGLAMEFAGEPYILWIEKEKYRDVVTATLRNRNNYATLVGLGLVAATGLLWHRLRQREPASWRHRLRRWILGLSRQGWLLAAWLVMMTALLLTESRAGLASTLLGLAVLAGLVAAISGSRRRSIAIAGLVGLLALAPLAISGEGLGNRLAHVAQDSRSRIGLYEEARRAIGDAPLLGFGSGTYPQVYYLYYDPQRGLQYPARYAHNTYLENALELGIPAAALLFLAALAALFGCLRGVFRRRRDRVYPIVAVAAGALGAAHATVDFSLQIAAVAFAWCVLVGIGLAQSRSSREDPA